MISIVKMIEETLTKYGTVIPNNDKMKSNIAPKSYAEFQDKWRQGAVEKLKKAGTSDYV